MRCALNKFARYVVLLLFGFALTVLVSTMVRVPDYQCLERLSNL